MPITRKQQLLAKLETTEGGGATFTSSDAVEVFDPSISDSVDLLDRSPAGATLSRDFTPVGRKTRDITFTSDLKGSGTCNLLVLRVPLDGLSSFLIHLAVGWVLSCIMSSV